MAEQTNNKRNKNFSSTTYGSFADLDRAARRFEAKQKNRVKKAKDTGRTAVENKDEYYEW